MHRLPILMSRAGWLLAGVMLGSCDIRLPVPHQPTQGMPPQVKSPPAKPSQDSNVFVWMVADSYHTGMVFPYSWLVESGFVPPAGIGSPQCVTLSWGSQLAYSKQGVHNPWRFCRVFLSSTPGVMELIPINWNVPEVCPNQRIWRKVVPRDRGPALAAFLNGCTVKDAAGRPKVLCESSWGRGVQLESRYRYFMPRICNVWTAQTIEALGGTVHPWQGLTADGLIRQIEKPPNDFELIWPGYGPQPKSWPKAMLTPGVPARRSTDAPRVGGACARPRG